MKKALILALCLTTTIIPQTESPKSTETQKQTQKKKQTKPTKKQPNVIKRCGSWFKKHVCMVADKAHMTTLWTAFMTNAIITATTAFKLSRPNAKEKMIFNKAIAQFILDIKSIFGKKATFEDCKDAVDRYLSVKTEYICIISTGLAIYFGVPLLRQLYKESKKDAKQKEA